MENLTLAAEDIRNPRDAIMTPRPSIFNPTNSHRHHNGFFSQRPRTSVQFVAIARPGLGPVIYRCIVCFYTIRSTCSTNRPNSGGQRGQINILYHTRSANQSNLDPIHHYPSKINASPSSCPMACVHFYIIAYIHFPMTCSKGTQGSSHRVEKFQPEGYGHNLFTQQYGNSYQIASTHLERLRMFALNNIHPNHF